VKVAIAGPTGVLGRSLVPLLLQQGHEVRALARTAAEAHRTFPALADVVECDLLAVTTAQLVPMLAGCDAAVHIATAIPRDPSVPGAWLPNARLRTEGTRKLLDAALQAGVGRYLQQSITMAYPGSGDDWITGEMPLDGSPESAPIRLPVLEMEQMVRETPPAQLHWTILRGGTFVGPGTFQDNAIARLGTGSEVVPCDGSNWVSLIHVADMAAAVAAALERAPAGTIFNVNDEPLRNGDYLDRLAASAGAPAPPRDPAAPCPPSWRCRNHAARTALRWQPRHPLIP
jgi:nucleoside-diphosphate-sugar epimerase